MHFAFDEEQEQLRTAARRFLDKQSSSTHVRAAMATDRGYNPEVWGRAARELGWTALLVPERYDGLGLGPVELTALMEEMGRALLCAPFFSTVCLATNALLEAGTEAQCQEYLPAIAGGDLTATVAYTEHNGRWGSDAIATTATRDGDDYVLAGEKTFVIDGHTAGLLIVAARAPETSGDIGVSLFAMPADAPGLSRSLVTTMDQTRKLATLTLDDVRVPCSQRLGEDGAGWPALARTLNLARVALAAEQLGGAERCMDLAVEYAKIRTQFGTPIGAFQAIKHKCADMLVQVESARSAAYYAAWVAANQPDELPVAAAMAQAYGSDAFFHCAAETIQVHGGVGFTWEHDAHLYFKRASSSGALFGDSRYHRDLVANRIGL